MRSEHAISVIVTVYNPAHFVREAVTSVMAQTAAPLEIIVVDDGCHDPLRRYLPSSSSLRLFRTERNQGVGAARNLGLAQARGDWVAFLDHDDLWRMDKLQRKVELIRSLQGRLDFVFCEKENFWGDDSRPNTRTYYRRQFNPKHPFESLVKGFFASPSTVMMRRQLAVECGGWQRDRVVQGSAYDDDYGLWLRAAASGARFGLVPEALVRYRRHQAQATRRNGAVIFALNHVRPLIKQRHLIAQRLQLGRIGMARLVWRRCLDLARRKLREGVWGRWQAFQVSLAGLRSAFSIVLSSSGGRRRTLVLEVPRGQEVALGSDFRLV